MALLRIVSPEEQGSVSSFASIEEFLTLRTHHTRNDAIFVETLGKA